LFLVDQDRINKFAEATDDHQFIHVDPEAAKLTPIGTTIAHGFLTLSLVIPLIAQIDIEPMGVKMSINYGLNKVRFIQPVKANDEIRVIAKLTDIREKDEGRILLTKKIGNYSLLFSARQKTP